MPRLSLTSLLALFLGGCTQRIVLTAAPVPAPARGDILSTLILIGDAGTPAPRGEPVFAALARLLADAPDSTTVLFLGDNIYPRGLPRPDAPNRADGERRILAQIAATRLVRTIFVPGNHDWDRSGPDGLAAIRREGEFVAAHGEDRVTLLPGDGCPGPEVRDAGGIRLILLDTEWWLYSDRPPIDVDCAFRSTEQVASALAAAIDSAGALPVIVAAHHPLASGGEHGGHFSLVKHLFPLREIHPALWLPLPLIGSIYPIARGAGVSSEDLSGGRNRRMQRALNGVFACHPPMLYASGHEHTLQLIDRGAPPLLAVSGAGLLNHEEFVVGVPGTRLALSEAGFMRVDRLGDGRIRLGVIVVNAAGEAREVHAEWLTLPEQSAGTGCTS
jgi:hypothetical protein